VKKLYKEPLPAYWASYLINGDRSGLDYDDELNNQPIGTEVAFIEKWLDNAGIEQILDVSDNSYYRRFNGLLTELADYTVTFSNGALDYTKKQ
jgi:hypothetical protein